MNAQAQGRARTTVPRATLRLQFHKDFPFAAAREQVPYFASLGISHLYASPITTARAGSMHGYDQVDPTTINPELGGEDALRHLVTELRAYGMGLIIDIVPNHMAVGRDDNPWWLDVLEWGRDARYASFFDIDWDVPDPALNNRLLAPFLGKPYGEALKDCEIELRFDATQGSFYAAYYEHRFPISPKDYGPLLRGQGAAFAELAVQFRAAVSERQTRSRRYDAFASACAALARQTREDAGIAAAIDGLLQHYSADSSEGRERLHGLLERQHYRLAWWRTAPDEINWRRFFDVIELAGLRMQEPAVFEAIHATPLRLYAEGLIDGLRIDHVDGLADPRGYCRKLRARLSALASQRPAGLPRGPAYFVVEKILAPDEQLARDWRTDGTTGYSFMNEVGALLHAPAGELPLSELWQGVTGRIANFDEVQRAARRRIPQELLAADFNACAHALHVCARLDTETRDWSLLAIRRVLAEVLVHFPVYRTYVDARGRSEADSRIHAQALQAASATVRAMDRPLLALFDRWLGGEAPQSITGAVARRARLRAIARFQQLSSPVAAKSVEDTAFYRHGRLLSRNEVGADPAQFSMSARDFHRVCSERQRRYPHALLATATHDHKRGEDLRARLAVISEVPDEWASCVERWRTAHASLCQTRSGLEGPDPADELMLYQMLVGALPADLAADDAPGLESLRSRLSAWQRKAIREAKRLSGWIEPNLEYEAACEAFLGALLDPSRGLTFLRELTAFVQRIAAAGAVNGLVQTLLKLTAPGVPDFYQGTEFWDQSLVDPDNRRPVDYAARAAAMAQKSSDAERLSDWRDGHVKQQLIARVLALRARRPALFAAGDYHALTPTGPQASHLLGFVRQHEQDTVLVVVPRCVSGLLSGDGLRFHADDWLQTSLRVPKALHGQRWIDVLDESGRTVEAPSALSMARLFQHWPLALLEVRSN